MKRITNSTILKQGDKIYQPVMLDRNLYWVDKYGRINIDETFINPEIVVPRIEIATIIKEHDGVRFVNNWADGLCTKVVAQSKPRLEEIPFIRLNNYIITQAIKKFPYTNEGPLEDDIDAVKRRIWKDGYDSNPNQYTQKDIEKAIELTKQEIMDGLPPFEGSKPKFTKEEILEQINSISVIEVDEQFNILNYR